ncbi:C-Jun-amino-terminal kinase-interacting protein 3-like [Tetranychus urticae]|uniref:C-Jun-amino-terminal kinase-interacting protein 3-like n=1 Tax=Tetranychus urticae TaxID=32264 RepID=UPI00077B92B6|nr:C-Jun-amino-terminal kinase-interacting protein 3-like [Tetranychus urticae]
MSIELDSDKNSKVSFTEPNVKEEENRDNLDNEILGVSAKKYEQLQVELEDCRNRIEELKLHRDEEKAGKEQTSKTLATYEKKTRDERQQYVRQINPLEIIVMMLKLKAKNSANHASRLEERLQELKTENEQLQSHCDFMMNIIIEGGYEMDTGQTDKVTSSNNNPTVSRNIDLTVTTAQAKQSASSTSSNSLSIASTKAASCTTASSIFVFGKPTASDDSLKVCSRGTERKNRIPTHSVHLKCFFSCLKSSMLPV